MRRNYTNIAIPIEVAREIDKYITDTRFGYSSRAQFVLDAIRSRFIEFRWGK
ncbi:MAG: CopG family transcriptional regulator [Phycisphaeraceae bacterium]|nr:CopG family transcriptional regulator [Phycisphaeraceae bacterium]